MTKDDWTAFLIIGSVVTFSKPQASVYNWAIIIAPWLSVAGFKLFPNGLFLSSASPAWAYEQKFQVSFFSKNQLRSMQPKVNYELPAYSVMQKMAGTLHRSLFSFPGSIALFSLFLMGMVLQLGLSKYITSQHYLTSCPQGCGNSFDAKRLLCILPQIRIFAWWPVLINIIREGLGLSQNKMLMKKQRQFCQSVSSYVKQTTQCCRAGKFQTSWRTARR